MLLQFGIAMPASRQQESEADYIGLMMMAKSCYNPEAAVGVWQRMQKAEAGGIPEWMSTHPSVSSTISFHMDGAESFK
jgi:predicted Zn-dependent protease